jgi:hypothetical protein
MAPNFPSFDDPGPHGVYRYSKNMLPEVRETEFRKGSQVSLLILMKVDIYTLVYDGAKKNVMNQRMG